MDKHGFDSVAGKVIVPAFTSDVVDALRELCKDTGVTELNVYYSGPSDRVADTPEWGCAAVLSGEKVTVEGRHSPSEAALAMAEQLLRNSVCALCERPVALMPGPHLPEPYCAWKLIGAEWTPGCSIENIVSMVTQPRRHVTDSPSPTDEEFNRIISKWSKEARGDAT